ncbi:MAG TPA: type II secretion system protein, partial [Tepidisphaeraceae bacterium]|nr:type II secretion system protein [Tepidisphaeraceae bacterium]
ANYESHSSGFRLLYMSGRRRLSNLSRGFSIIELLVVMAIMVILLSMLLSAAFLLVRAARHLSGQ